MKKNSIPQNQKTVSIYFTCLSEPRHIISQGTDGPSDA